MNYQSHVTDFVCLVNTAIFKQPWEHHFMNRAGVHNESRDTLMQNLGRVACITSATIFCILPFLDYSLFIMKHLR